MKALCDDYQMQLLTGQVTGIEEKEGKLSEIKVTGADGVTRRLPLDYLMVFFGLSPKLGPIAEWGLEIERKQLKVDTEKFQTNASKRPFSTESPARDLHNAGTPLALP